MQLPRPAAGTDRGTTGICANTRAGAEMGNTGTNRPSKHKDLWLNAERMGGKMGTGRRSKGVSAACCQRGKWTF